MREFSNCSVSRRAPRGTASWRFGRFIARRETMPNDPLIAHSHARAALEAGRPATELFDRAARLAPQDGAVLLGRTAALAAEHSLERAIVELATIVRKNPLWLEGHRTLARLRGQQGLDPAHGVLEALSALPGQADLHRELIAIRLEARDLDGADAASATALLRIGQQPWLAELFAHIASERGSIETCRSAVRRAGPAPSDRHGCATRAPPDFVLLVPSAPSN